MVAASFQAASAASAPVLLAPDDGVKEEYASVRLYPTQMRFVTGIARAYDDDFPPELSPLIKKQDFETAINQINNTMKDYWPCFFCVCCGYSCCICTVGLSLLCPNMCIRDAEQYVRALIARINRRHCFSSAGVEWQLVRTCGRSYIEISYPLSGKSIKKEVTTYQGSALDAAISSSLTRTSYANGTGPRANAASRLVVDV